MFKKIILFYGVLVLFFWGFAEVSIKLFNPTVVAEKDIKRSKVFSQLKVKDFIKNEYTFYILSIDNKIHIFDIQTSKFINVFSIEGIGEIEKITVHNHIKVGKNHERKLYIGFLSNNKVYLSKLNKNTDKKILKPKLIFDGLKNPIDIYLYNEYYKNLSGKYQDNIVVLKNDNNKSILNVYNLETKELLEQLDAEISFISIGNKTLNHKINPKNIINFNRINVGNHKTKRVFLDKIELAPDNHYVMELGNITHTYYGSYYIFPDIKNKTLWINDSFWIFQNHMIQLNKVPEKAHTLSGRGEDNDIYDGISTVRFLVKYKDSNKLEVIKTGKSLLKEITDFSRNAFELLILPFVSIAYISMFIFR